MSELNIDKALEPVNGEKPEGADLEYDPRFAQLDQFAAGKPEQQVGSNIIPAEEPNWKEVLKLGSELILQSKDIRIAMHLAMALVRQSGVSGVERGLALIRGLLEKHWPVLYPKLDPEEHNDPLGRMNIISTLTHSAGYLKLLREVPLAFSPRAGKFNLRDIEIAKGTIPAPENHDPNVPLPDMALIQGAFSEMNLEELRKMAQLMGQSLEHVKAIDAFLTTTVGAGKSINFGELQKSLASCKKMLDGAVEGKGGVAGAPVGASPAMEVPAASGMGPSISGDIRGKVDILKAIDKICDYYGKFEPSSPIPLLLKRVRRLVDKNFLEIIKELNPAALAAIEQLAGIDPGQQG
jgi:type VI secretion system protein ImpA